MNPVSPEQIKKMRSDRGWTQEQLARISGLSYRTIQRIERDGRCSLDSKMALASAFAVSLVHLSNSESSLLESLFILSCVHDGKGNFLSVDTSNPELLLVPRDQIVGFNCTDFLPPSVAKKMLDAIDTIKGGDKTVEFEYQLMMSEVEQSFKAKMIQTGADSFLSVVTDISEQKANQRELQRNVTLLSAAADTVRTGAWEVDLQTKEIFWTKQVFEIYGVDTMPTVEQGILFYAPEAQPLIRQAFEELCETGKPYELDLPFLTASGDPIWVRVSGEPHYQQSLLIRVSGVIQDITHLKQDSAAEHK